MSQENVEVVREHIEAYRAGDPVAASFLDEYVVRDQSRIGGFDPVAYGVAAVIQGTVEYRGAFADYDYVVELRDLGAGQVLPRARSPVAVKAAGPGWGARSRCSIRCWAARSSGSLLFRMRGKPSKLWACRSSRYRGLLHGPAPRRAAGLALAGHRLDR